MSTQSKIDGTRVVGTTVQKNWGENHLALTDGIVTARSNGASLATSNTTWVKISTGVTAGDTFALGDGFVGNPQTLFACATFPVKKGQYYKIDTYSSNGSSYFQAFFTPFI